MNEEEKTLLLDEHWAVIGIPEDAVSLDMQIGLVRDGRLIYVEGKLDTKGVRMAFKRADDGYIDEDDKFYLTETGKALGEKLFGDQ